MICTPEQLVTITHRVRPTAQAKVLVAMGITFKPRPDGTLAVSVLHVEHLLGGVPKGKVEREWQPNWEGA